MAINQKWWQSTIANLGMWTGINGWLETVIPYDEITKPSNKQTEKLAAFKRNPAYQSRFTPETLRGVEISNRIAPNQEISTGEGLLEEQSAWTQRRKTDYEENRTGAPLFNALRWRDTQGRIGWWTVLNGYNWWPLLRHSHQPNSDQMYYQGFLANTMSFFTAYYQEWAGGDTYNFRREFNSRTKKVIKTLDWKLNNKGEIYPARNTKVAVTGVDKPDLKDYGDIAVWPQLMWGDLPRLQGLPVADVPAEIRTESESGIFQNPRYYSSNSTAGSSDRVIVSRQYTNLVDGKQLFRMQFEYYREIFGPDATIAQVDKFNRIISMGCNVAKLIKPAQRTGYFQLLAEWINQNYNTQLTSRAIKKIISLGGDRYNENWCLAAPVSGDTRYSGGRAIPFTWDEITSESKEVIRNRSNPMLANANLQDWVLDTMAACIASEETIGGNPIGIPAALLSPNASQIKRTIVNARFRVGNELRQISDFTLQEWEELFWSKLQTGSIPQQLRAAILQKPASENREIWNAKIELAWRGKFGQNFSAVHENGNWVELLLCPELMPLGANQNTNRVADRLPTANLITPNRYGDDAWWDSFVGENGFMKYGEAHLWYSLDQLHLAWPRMRALAEEELLQIPVWLQSTAEEAWQKVYQGQSLVLRVYQAANEPGNTATEATKHYSGGVLPSSENTFMLPDWIRGADPHITTSEKLTDEYLSGLSTSESRLIVANTPEELNDEFNRIVPSYYRNSDTIFTGLDIETNGSISNVGLLIQNNGQRAIQRLQNAFNRRQGWTLLADENDAEWQQIAEENSEYDIEDYGKTELFMFDLPESWNFRVNRNMEYTVRPRFGFIINWSQILSYRIKTMLNPDN